jgi:hypothetical protein
MIAKRTSERLQALKAQGTPWVSKEKRPACGTAWLAEPAERFRRGL